VKINNPPKETPPPKEQPELPKPPKITPPSFVNDREDLNSLVEEVQQTLQKE
jgi:hypothetical protein